MGKALERRVQRGTRSESNAVHVEIPPSPTVYALVNRWYPLNMVLEYTEEGEYVMDEKKREIEKMQISLVDTENNFHTFELKRINEKTGVRWSYIDKIFQLEITTDDEIKNVQVTGKSVNLVESNESVIQKFLDAAFEYKMNLLINIEDGFDEAEEEENGETEKIDPYDPKLIRVDTKTFSLS